MINYKLFKDFSIENIDNFCSILGEEILVQFGKELFLIIPIYNTGFYENAVNPEAITKSVDYSLFVLENPNSLDVKMYLYKDIFRTEFSEEKEEYKVLYNDFDENILVKSHFEGLTYRRSSYSYGSYVVLSKAIHLILLGSARVKEYKSRNEFLVSNNEIIKFLELKHFINENALKKILKKI